MAGSTGDSGERKPDGFTTQLFIVIAAIYTTIASGVGNIIASDFQRRQPLMFALLGGLVVVVSGWYVLRQRRSRRPAPPAESAPGPVPEAEPSRPPGIRPPGILDPRNPRAGASTASPAGRGAAPAGGAAPPASAAPPARTWVIVIMCALLAVAFAVGYWTIGNGFAHSDALGYAAVAGVLACAAVAMVVAWFSRRPRWAAWLVPGSRMAMACAVAGLGLSAGGTLGSLDLVPSCPVPTELRVLTSEEALPGVQNATTMFEQDEQAILHQGCYAVDLTAYAAPSDAAAEEGLESGWGASALSTSGSRLDPLSTSGPRPDIWIPASSAETDAVSAALDTSGAAVPQLGIGGSVASSRVVVAVPNSLIARDSIYGTDTSGKLGTIYQLLAGHGISLGMPSPRESAAALLGVIKLYGDLKPGTERKIEASGNFPADSATLLCQGAQAAQQAQPTGQQPPPAAYLVSEAAVNLNNAGRLTGLTEGACPTLTEAPPPLTPLYPLYAPLLDFPFVTVSWDGDPATALAGGQERKQRFEMDFYHWLASPAGRAALKAGGLGKPQPATAPLPSASQVTGALERFQAAQAPARILVAIDDSGPMETYLPQVEAATAAALGPSSSPRSSSRTESGALGARDSFGIWAYPGPRKATHAELIPFGPATAGRLTSVAVKVSGLSADGHSAQFDLLTEAARLLYGRPPGKSGAINSVVLLTDGDSQALDPGSGNFVTVTQTALRPPSLPAQSRIKVFVIAFGPTGCGQAPPDGQTLEALATSTGGTCVNASGDLTRQLSLLISQLAGG
jgi:Bacterial extracellular solute-binding protein